MKLLRGISLFAAIILAGLTLSGAVILQSQRKLASDLVRLRVIGASDTEEDQEIKLKIRDWILKTVEKESVDNVEDAEALIENRREDWKNQINTLLAGEGVSYRVDISLENVEYPTCSYETFSLPAGLYRACTVTLGEGKGHNWWCVLFPPLCYSLETEDEAVEASGLIMHGDGDLKIRFKFRVLEWIQAMEERIQGR